MKKWLLSCSKDAAFIHWETILESETEPDFWECYRLADCHGCAWFTLEQIGGEPA